MLHFRAQAVFNKRWFPLVLGVKARHNPAGGHEERPGRLANVRGIPFQRYFCADCVVPLDMLWTANASFAW